jgi:hypothetical protein
VPKPASRKSKPSTKASWRFEKPRQRKSGKKPGGKPPKPPTAGPKAQDQLNLTDEQSRIMPVAGGGFEQSV